MDYILDLQNDMSQKHKSINDNPVMEVSIEKSRYNDKSRYYN